MSTSLNEAHLEQLKGAHNFDTWSISIRSILESHDLEQCIAARESDPAAALETDGNKLKQAKTRIMLSIDPQLYVHVQNCSTAFEVWKILNDMYNNKGLFRRISLLKELAICNLHNCISMTEYISSMIGTVNKLKGIGFDINEDWIASILLSGLTDEFQPFIMAVEGSASQMPLDAIKSKLYQMTSISSSKMTNASIGNKTKSKNSACFKWNRAVHQRNDGSSGKHKTKTVTLLSDDTQSNNAFSASGIKMTNEIWVVDSGASQHMCVCKDDLENVQRSSTKYVNTPDGRKLEVTCVGDLLARVDNNDIKISNVLCVPRLMANLLSISCISKSGNRVSFVNDNCEIYNRFDRLMCKSKIEDGIYKLYLMHPRSPNPSQQHKASIVTWHRRFGHMNYPDLRKLLLVVGIDFIDTNDDPVTCGPCVMNREHRPLSNREAKRSMNLLDVVHVAIYGPMEEISIQGAKYVIMFIDDYSRKTFDYFFISKNDALENLTEFKTTVELQTGRKIKCLRTGNDTEFKRTTFQRFLKKCQIVHEAGPEQTELTEQMSSILFDRAKCMLFDADLPKKYWAEAMHTAVYLMNRSITGDVNKMPEELWSGAPVDLSNLKIFGTPAMAFIPKGRRKKTSAQLKSRPLIFVGYSSNNGGYRLIDPMNGQLTICRDIVVLNPCSDTVVLLDNNSVEAKVASKNFCDHVSYGFVFKSNSTSSNESSPIHSYRCADDDDFFSCIDYDVSVPTIHVQTEPDDANCNDNPSVTP